MFCENCGGQLSDTAKFCTKCGAKVVMSHNLSNKENKSANKPEETTNKISSNKTDIIVSKNNRQKKAQKIKNADYLKDRAKLLGTGCLISCLLIFIPIIIISCMHLNEKKAKKLSGQTQQEQKSENKSCNRDCAISLVKKHKIPNGMTVDEQIRNKEVLNYGNGEWKAYKPGQGTDCPMDVQNQDNTDWIVCYKTIFEVDAHEYAKNPTWRIKNENVFPMNGTASQHFANDEIPPESGYASYSQGKTSKKGAPPTKRECDIRNDWAKNAIRLDQENNPSTAEEMDASDNQALEETAKRYGMSAKEVREIIERINKYSDGDKIICP